MTLICHFRTDTGADGTSVPIREKAHSGVSPAGAVKDAARGKLMEKSSSEKKEILLKAEGVYKEFPTGKKGQAVHAVNGVDLTILHGETLALVGESGCGKSTLGRTLIHMLPLTDGIVTYRNQVI